MPSKKDTVICAFFGYALLMAYSLLLYFTFLLAYFSGGKRVIIEVDRYGEAHIEFILIPITLIIATILFYYVYRYLKNGE